MTGVERRGEVKWKIEERHRWQEGECDYESLDPGSYRKRLTRTSQSKSFQYCEME